MNPKESQTPRVDKAEFPADVAVGKTEWVVCSDAARQLELECAALREALEKVRDRFFPADQAEADRDLLWDEVNSALDNPAARAALGEARKPD